ncbi:MAG: Wzz/FepE/Etk N-terminal domain-containing protein [candidate division Zixibacteria bacterium]|nr:Wzz/FepE/Etk N-terminal domain-containing protein [candidate division Zixibacteria bacterium]
MSSGKASGQIDIQEILALVWRRKWLVITPVPLVAVLAFAGSYLLTPEYESTSIVAIDPQIQLIGDIQRLLTGPSTVGEMQNRDYANQLKSIYNELTSSHYAELLLERMSTVLTPKLEETAQHYVQLNSDLSIEIARVMVMQEVLKERVSVEWASVDQVRIIVREPLATEARDVANTIGDIFIAEKIRQDLNNIRSSQDFSDVQLQRYERQVQDKVAEITRGEQRLARMRSADATMSVNNRSEIDDEIHQMETDISDLRDRERALVAGMRGVDGINPSQLTLDDSDAKKVAETELNSRISEVGDLLSRYAWNNPQVINFKLRENHLLETIEAENQKLVDAQYARFNQSVRKDLADLVSARARLNYLYSRKPYLESALNDLTPSTDLIPELEAQLAQLQRELQVATDIRDRFRRQQESSAISQALLEDRSSSKYRKVEPAKLALVPVSPDRQRILIMGILLGLVLGGATVILVELMDSSFRKVEDVEETLGLKVIAVSPRIDFDKSLTG